METLPPHPPPGPPPAKRDLFPLHPSHFCTEGSSRNVSRLERHQASPVGEYILLLIVTDWQPGDEVVAETVYRIFF